MEGLGFTPHVVKDYIIDQLKDNTDFLFNELDLQMFVVRALEQKFDRKSYVIHLEYHLPKGWNEEFDEAYERWGETPYFDIVLEEKGLREGTLPSFIAIELKYKLKEVRAYQSFQRFGTYAPNQGIVLVKNQSAQNEGRYDFWKDVKRLELLKKYFDNVVGGVSIFVTNDDNYKLYAEDCKYSKYSFKSSKTGKLFWNHDSTRCQGKICDPQLDCNCGEDDKCINNCGESKKKSDKGFNRPNFELEKEYSGEWNVCKKDGINTGYLYKVSDDKFYCYSVLVLPGQDSTPENKL